MIPRDALTKIFLKQWGKCADDVNVAFYSRRWWNSLRVGNQAVYRLSDEGFKFLTETITLKCYEIPFTEAIELSPQTLVFLERYLDCPYYISHKSITVFSEKKCFELYLFSDDIRKYGILKAMKERQSNI